MKETKLLLLLTILFCTIYIPSFAQSAIYEYDSQGNVISRKEQVVNISKPGNGIDPGVKIDKDDGNITINISENTDDETSIRIYDSSPRFIEKRTFTGSAYSIDLGSFPKGMYILEVEHAKEIYTEKFFKN